MTRGSTLNANLSRIGAGSNGMCNPYVSIRCVPDVDGTNFRQRGLKKVKTNVKHRTLFPLLVYIIYNFFFSNIFERHDYSPGLKILQVSENESSPGFFI